MPAPELTAATKTFDEDALQSQRSAPGYSFAMGDDAAKRAAASASASSLIDAAEGWKSEPSPSDDGFAGASSGFTFTTSFGAASSIRSYWGTSGYMGSMVTLDLAGRARLTSPYAQDPTFFACLDKLGKAIGALPWRLEREVMVDGEPRWLPVSRYGDMGGRGGKAGARGSGRVQATSVELALMALLNRPSPIHTGRAFRTAFVQHFMSDGEVLLMFMQKVAKAGDKREMTSSKQLDAPIEKVPDYLWPVGGSQARPMTEDRVGAMPRVFHLSDGTEWPAGSGAWCIMVTPDSAVRGMGPLSAVRRKLDQNYQIDRFDDALLRNGGMPGGFFYTPDRLDRGKKRGIQQSWQETQAGSQNAGKIAVIDGGAEFKPASFKPSEMEFSAMRESNDQYVRMVMGATKPVLGITDDVNRANAHEAMRVWYEVTVKPLADLVLDCLNCHFVERLVPLRSGGARHRLAFDYSDVPFLREDADAKVKRATEIAKAFSLAPRDAAKLAGWREAEESDADGLDERWVEGKRVPLEVAQDPATHQRPSSGASPEPGKALEPQTKDASKDDEEDPEEAARAWEARAFAAWKAHDDFLVEHERSIKKPAEKVLRSYVLAARKRLAEIAAGERAVESPAAARARIRAEKRGEPVRKYVASEAEIQRALELNLAEWQLLMEQTVLPKVGETVVDAAQALNLEFSGGSTVLQLTDPKVVQFLAEKEVLLVEGSTSTLAKEVQKKIVKVLAGAEEAVSLSSAIQETLEELQDEMKIMLEGTGARAERIARTEAASASSFGRAEQMAIDGIERHTWVSSRDGATRDEHLDLDGETRRVGEVFGHRLAYPGDSSHGADASAVVNCRCTTIPEFED